MNRVIITGGGGFIGRHLLNKLLPSKLNSIALISKKSKIKDKYLKDSESQVDLPLTFYTADVRDRNAISNIFLDERPDTCIHLAAKINVTDSIKNPDEIMEINVKGTINVLDACYDNKVKNFVFASSAAVYGDVRELPISEDHPLAPLSAYGTSKMLAEQHVFSYSKLKKIQNSILLRIFNVYGNGQSSETDIITNFALRLSKGLPPVIYGDGLRTRDFVSVSDVVDGILLSIKAMEGIGRDRNNKLTSASVFNIGTGTPTSINELAQKMIAIFGLDLQPIYAERRQHGRVILHSYANMAKTKEILHFVPKKVIDVGLRELIGSMLTEMS